MTDDIISENWCAPGLLTSDYYAPHGNKLLRSTVRTENTEQRDSAKPNPNPFINFLNQGVMGYKRQDINNLQQIAAARCHHKHNLNDSEI